MYIIYIIIIIFILLLLLFNILHAYVGYYILLVLAYGCIIMHFNI